MGEKLRNKWATESLKYTSLAGQWMFGVYVTMKLKLTLNDKTPDKDCTLHSHDVPKF